MPGDRYPRAVVADGFHFVRSTIGDILSEGGIDVVTTARDGRAAVAAAGEDGSVDETTRTTGVNQINGNEVITHSDETYRVIHLGERFEAPGAHSDHSEGIAGSGDRDDGMLVRIGESERGVALHCDEVTSQEEVVVKPLEGISSVAPGLSGTAVLGDGNIVHILDGVTL